MSSDPTVYERYDDPARQGPTPAKQSEVAVVEKTGTPDAVREAEIVRGKDSLAPDSTAKKKVGVEWVRPTELIARQAGAVAGRGIDFQAELARRARTPAVAAMRQVSERARRLPPVSAFGRRGGHQSVGGHGKLPVDGHEGARWRS